MLAVVLANLRVTYGPLLEPGRWLRISLCGMLYVACLQVPVENGGLVLAPLAYAGALFAFGLVTRGDIAQVLSVLTRVAR